MTKGTGEELVKHLKLKKTQLNQLSNRGSKKVRTKLGKTKEKLEGKGVVTKRPKITNVFKKTFRVTFNADKTRLDKRQIK